MNTFISHDLSMSLSEFPADMITPVQDKTHVLGSTAKQMRDKSAAWLTD